MSIKEFGIRLKELRRARKMSTTDLAKLVGVSNSTISRWENAKISPTLEYVEKFADIFGVTTDYLHGRED